jgi:pimeloyl-ACP methyl ester carboxylesterase
MIAAVRHIRGVPGSPPFLIGFSEGGYASLAAQRALEAAGEKVLGVAAVAGAYNLRAISIPWTLRGASPQASVYLALWVRGYATRYGHPLNTAFTPHYAALVPELLDTPHDVDAVIKALPRDPRALFLPVTLNAIEGKGRHWLVDALAENEMGDWRARAPIRLYYGADDVDVPPSESIATARQMTARGSNVHAVNVGPFDHNQSILAAVPLILHWLEELSSSHTG